MPWPTFSMDITFKHVDPEIIRVLTGQQGAVLMPYPDTDIDGTPWDAVESAEAKQPDFLQQIQDLAGPIHLEVHHQPNEIAYRPAEGVLEIPAEMAENIEAEHADPGEIRAAGGWVAPAHIHYDLPGDHLIADNERADDGYPEGGVPVDDMPQPAEGAIDGPPQDQEWMDEALNQVRDQVRYDVGGLRPAYYHADPDGRNGQWVAGEWGVRGDRGNARAAYVGGGGGGGGVVQGDHDAAVAHDAVVGRVPWHTFRVGEGAFDSYNHLTYYDPERYLTDNPEATLRMMFEEVIGTSGTQGVDRLSERLVDAALAHARHTEEREQ